MENKPIDGMSDQRLRQEERLRSKKQIDLLFQNGRSIKAFPLLTVWNLTTSPQEWPAKMAVSVSKKRFKKAVDRNRVKRLVREAYRKQKPMLYQHLEEQDLQVHLIFIFTGKKLPEYSEIESVIIRIIDRLNKDITLHKTAS